jgi:SOS-response transcriptional repressor LexA
MSLKPYIEALKEGKPVKFRPKGNSMEGLISSGQLVTVEPRGARMPQKGDIVLCKVKGLCTCTWSSRLSRMGGI